MKTPLKSFELTGSVDVGDWTGCVRLQHPASARLVKAAVT